LTNENGDLVVHDAPAVPTSKDQCSKPEQARPGPLMDESRMTDGVSMTTTQVPPPTFEPKWGINTMLRDLAYLLRLTRRTSLIDF
jgi:hypothetical protein